MSRRCGYHPLPSVKLICVGLLTLFIFALGNPIVAMHKHRRNKQALNWADDTSMLKNDGSDVEATLNTGILHEKQTRYGSNEALSQLIPAVKLVNAPNEASSLPFESLAESLYEAVTSPMTSVSLLAKWLNGSKITEIPVRRFRTAQSVPRTVMGSTEVKVFAQTVPIQGNMSSISGKAHTTLDLGVNADVVEMNCFAGKKLTATRTHFTVQKTDESNKYAQHDDLNDLTGQIKQERISAKSQDAANILSLPAVSSLPEGYPASQPDATVVYTDEAGVPYYTHSFPFTDGCVQTEFWFNQTFLHNPSQLSVLLEIDTNEATVLVNQVKRQPGDSTNPFQTFTWIEDADTSASTVPVRVPESRGKEVSSWRMLATRVCKKIVEKYTGESPLPPSFTQTSTNQNAASTSSGFEGVYPLGSDLQVCERLAQCRKRDSVRAQPESLEFCACPYDYAGSNCQTPREIRCSAHEHPFDSPITCSVSSANSGHNPQMSRRGFSNTYDARMVGTKPCREVPRKQSGLSSDEKYKIRWNVVPQCHFGILAEVDINAPTSTPENLKSIVWQGPSPSVLKTLEEGEYAWDKGYNFDYVLFRPLHDGSNATFANRDAIGAVPPRFALSVRSDASPEERDEKLNSITMETYIASHDRLSDRRYSNKQTLAKQILEEIDLWSAAISSDAKNEVDMDSTSLKLEFDLKAVTVTDAFPPGSSSASNDNDPIPKSIHQLHYFPGGRASLQARIIFADSIRLPFASQSYVDYETDAVSRGVKLAPPSLIGTGNDDDSRPALIMSPKSFGSLTVVDVTRYDPGAPKSRPLTSIQKVIIGVSCAAFVIVVIMLVKCWLEAREKRMFRKAKEEAAERAALLRQEKQDKGEDPDDILSSANMKSHKHIESSESPLELEQTEPSLRRRVTIAPSSK